SSVNYSWAHSIDLGSSDSMLFMIIPGQPATGDRGSSDFDVRHSVHGAFSYVLPGKWTLSGIWSARTGFPIDVMLSETLNGAAISNYRPNLVSGVPLWIADPQAPGGRRLQSSAFGASQGWRGQPGAQRDCRLR